VGAGWGLAVRLGRISSGSWIGFAVSTDSEQWLPMPCLGVDPADTGTAIAMARLWESWGYPQPADELVHADALHCPITPNQRIVGAGANFAAHAAEVGMSASVIPHLFERSPSTLAASGDTLMIRSTPDQHCDYEVELAVVVDCRPSASVGSPSSVFGYAVANDLTLRALQQTDPTITCAKSAPRSCPIGPYITTADELPELGQLEMRSSVNGVLRQHAFLDEMVHSAVELIAAIERAAPLRAGDVVLTGSPAGTAVGDSSVDFLQNGDVVECSIAQIGSIQNTVRLRKQLQGALA
jgi:2-keto-4-pentenoate hydratase/2-oxohepta-3-ene-1,7-dioic acid hydratase in catechol pathway